MYKFCSFSSSSSSCQHKLLLDLQAPLAANCKIVCFILIKTQKTSTKIEIEKSMPMN